LRRILFFAGIIFLLTGLALLVAGSMRNINKVIVNSEIDSWEVRGNLTNGDTYIMDVKSSYYWRDNYTSGGYATPQPVDVVITSPDEGETRLQAFFYARVPTSQYYQGTFPSLVHIEYETVDSDSIEVDESYPQIRFRARQDGIYTMRLVKETLNWTSTPPQEIELYKEEVVDDSPLMIPSGGVLCLVGLLVSIYGKRTTKKFKIRQRKIKSASVSLLFLFLEFLFFLTPWSCQHYNS